MYTKNVGFHQLYYADEEVRQIVPPADNIYNDLGNLKRFTGSHPEVMRARIAASAWAFDPKIEEQHPDWWRHVLLFLHPLTRRLKRWAKIPAV
jgi:hypothetical protein